MDPEQLYQEVLQEEQQKGSSPAVAEGRAKSARQRAVHGSPHPKEPKWWPGAQPQFEDGGAPAEAPAEEAAAETEPAPEPQPEPAAPAEQPAPEPAPAAEEPAAPAAEEPAAQPAAQPAAVATAAPVPTLGPAYQPTIGTSPGLPSGNRLRPEDAVSTEAQFNAQRAMEQRRKLIDDLVSSGVPAVTAAEGGRQPSAWVSVLFLVIPLIAILFLVNNDDLRDTAPAGGETEEHGGGEGGAAESSVVAEGFAFEPSEITVSDEVVLENRDSAPHNIYIYPDEQSATAHDPGDAIFTGEDAAGGESVTYALTGVEPGTYPYICQIHPSMMGTITIE